MNSLFVFFKSTCSFDFVDPKRRLAVFLLTSNILVIRHGYFLVLDFLAIILVIVRLGISYMLFYGVDTISSSIISFRFFWPSHLPAYWYILLMLFKHLCSKEDMLHNYWSIPIVFIWSSRRGDCNIPLITTHCFFRCINRYDRINGLIHYPWFYTLVSMRISTVNLKTQIFFTRRGWFFVVCNSTGAIGSVVFNGLKRVVLDVAWTL